MSKRKRKRQASPPAETASAKHDRLAKAERDGDLPPGSLQPYYDGHCVVCGQSPILPVTGMCGPCSFGDAETFGGNW